MVIRRRKKIDWTAEMDAIVRSCTASEAAAKLGITRSSINLRRWVLRSLDERAASQRPSVPLDETLARKIAELEPLLVQRYRDAGLPISRLEPWQIIEMAVNELLNAAKRSRTRQLYLATPAQSEAGGSKTGEGQS